MAFNLTAQLNIALNSASLRNASSQLNAALNSNTQVKLGIDRGSASGLGQIKSQISEATDSMENFGRQAGFAAKRFAAFAVTAGSIIAFTNTMKEAVSAAVDFDREMIRLRQVSSDTVQDVGAVGEQVTNLSKNLGVSSKDLIGVAVVLKQANLTLAETKDALEAMAQAALAPNFDNLKDTTEGAIAIMKQFKVEAKDLGAALGSVNAVAGEFAVEASDIIEAIRKTGGAFKAAGGQLNELIALFTSVRQTTRESAESIGTGLRTIFTRIQRNDTANALKEVGINLRYTADEARALGDAGLEQQFVGPYEAVKRLSAGLSDLRSTDPRFSAIVEQLGGYRQISKVIPLIQEFATAQKALGIAQAGSVSLAVNAGQAQDALAVKLQKLKESFFEVGRSIVNSPGFRSLADTFIGAATSVLSLINSLKGLLPLFTALAAVKIGQGLGSFATGFVKGAGADNSSARTNKKAYGGFLRMRTGGIVPGSGTGDKVPALLEPGELVIPKGMVRRQMYETAGVIKNNDKTKETNNDKKYNNPRGKTHFTHVDLGSNSDPKYSDIRKLYSNFGLDLPGNWNTDWATHKNNIGVPKKNFINYLSNKNIFATYQGKKTKNNLKTYA
ncbi:MAG: phage tail tape measure protein, partial [Bacteroidota bacterium]